MKKKYQIVSMALIMSLVFVGCDKAGGPAKDSSVMEDNSKDSGAATDEGENSGSIADDSIKIKDTQKLSETDINLTDYQGNLELTKGGEYILTGSLTEGLLYINTDEAVTLILNNATIESPKGPAIYVRQAESVVLRLADGTQNSLSDNRDTEYETLNAVLYSKADLFLEGRGSLNINADYQHGIRGKDDVVISEGTYTIESVLDCIHANDDLQVEGGELQLQSNGDECMQSETNLILDGGNITCASAGDAIRSEDGFVMNDGKVVITQASEGIESKNTLEINGGEIKITCSDDSINGANAVTVNGGTIMSYSTDNDVLDSNGSMIINGGTFYGVGIRSPEGVFDCDHNNFEINGGTLLGLGMANSQPTKGKQCTLLLNPKITDTIKNLIIKDSRGNVVYQYEPDDYTTVLSEVSTQLQDNAATNDSATTEEEGKDFGGAEDGHKPSDGKAPEDRGKTWNGKAPEDEGKPWKGQVPEGEHKPVGGTHNSKMPWSDKGMGKGASDGITLFISNQKLKKGKKYTIYVNGKKIDTVKMQNPVTTLGEIFTMGGRGGW